MQRACEWPARRSDPGPEPCVAALGTHASSFAFVGLRASGAGVRVFDISNAFAPREIAYWVPPIPQRMIDPRPNVTLAPKTADVYVNPDGLMYVTDWNGGLNVLQYEG